MGLNLKILTCSTLLRWKKIASCVWPVCCQSNICGEMVTGQWKLHIKTINNSTGSYYTAASRSPINGLHINFCIRLNCCSPENSALQVFTSIIFLLCIEDSCSDRSLYHVSSTSMTTRYTIRKTAACITNICLFHNVKCCFWPQTSLWWSSWKSWWKYLLYKEITNLTPFFLSKPNWIQLNILLNVCKKGPKLQIHLLVLSVTVNLWKCSCWDDASLKSQSDDKLSVLSICAKKAWTAT